MISEGIEVIKGGAPCHYKLNNNISFANSGATLINSLIIDSIVLYLSPVLNPMSYDGVIDSRTDSMG